MIGSSHCPNSMTDNGSPDLRGFGAGVAKLRSAEKSRKCADVSRSRPHLRMQFGDPMWRRMAPHRFAAWRCADFRRSICRQDKCLFGNPHSILPECPHNAKPLLAVVILLFKIVNVYFFNLI
ncbi:MAG: hypothetical protein JPMHGGIA_02618 [Saprospiraceae bacterium]|jgi:hypothetical protein|nr:hypothetical protein [Saprospiraceae bacterium]